MGLLQLVKKTALASTIVISAFGCDSFSPKVEDKLNDVMHQYKIKEPLPKGEVACDAHKIPKSTKEERQMEYIEKIKGTYVEPKYYEPEIPEEGCELSYTNLVFLLKKHSKKRADEKVFGELNFNSIKDVYFIRTSLDREIFARQGIKGSYLGDKFEKEFTNEAQDDFKSILTRAMVDTLKETWAYRTISRTINDYTFDLIEIRYVGNPKKIPQIPVVDDFQEKAEHPYKYEPEKISDAGWLWNRLKRVRLGIDFATSGISNINKESIPKIFPRIYLRWADLLRFRLDLENRELQSTLSMGLGDFGLGMSSEMNYEMLEQKKASAGISYLLSENAIIRTSFTYDFPVQDKEQGARFEAQFFWKYDKVDKDYFKWWARHSRK